MSEEPKELYRKHRPIKFSQILGQDAAIRSLNDLGRRDAVPHCLLLSGPSGCGKTTIARILARKLRCSRADFKEMNSANFRGIDMVRNIQRYVELAPMGGGKSRVWLLDEVHKLTGDAQTAFLKLLEDTPGHVYFMLATTEPGKLLETVRNRATEIVVKSLGAEDMEGLLRGIAVEETSRLDLPSGDVLDKIIDAAEGSPRKALVVLNQVIGLDTEEEQLAAIEAGHASRQGIEVARALLDEKTSWAAMAGLLKAVDEDPESLRWMVLGFMASVMLGGGGKAARAFAIVDVFSENFYSTKKAGLVAACWEVITGEGK